MPGANSRMPRRGEHSFVVVAATAPARPGRASRSRDGAAARGKFCEARLFVFLARWEGTGLSGNPPRLHERTLRLSCSDETLKDEEKALLSGVRGYKSGFEQDSKENAIFT